MKEMWWDRSHSWSAALSGYRVFQEEHAGKLRTGTHPYVKDQWEYMELYIRFGEGPLKSSGLAG